MSQRIACLVRPLLRLPRRPHGPTAHHAGYRPPGTAGPPVILGIGAGSLGMPVVEAEGDK
jgi:hypothetical protein